MIFRDAINSPDFPGNVFTTLNRLGDIMSLSLQSITDSDLSLLEALCSVHGPSGNESAVRDFILKHIKSEMESWVAKPEIFSGDEYQNNLMLVFGKPRTALYAHMDSIGYTVRYDMNLIKIGGPLAQQFTLLKGEDSGGPFIGTLIGEGNELSVEVESHCDASCDAPCEDQTDRALEPGTDLVYHHDFRSGSRSIQSPYLDNRMGCWLALLAARTITDGVICFTTWEEHGGGSAGYLSSQLYDRFGVRQSIICDMTYVTEGIRSGRGPVISMRDRHIPRRSYVDRVISIAREAGIPFQIEVEASGGSDGSEIQLIHRPVDWCFIGVAEEHYHTPDEKVLKVDVINALKLHSALMENL